MVVHALLRWLLTPLSGVPHGRPPSWEAWHGRLMVAAWTVLLPVGALVARFGKVPRRTRWPERLDDTRWWQTHRTVQWTGVSLMSGAAALAFLHAGGRGAAATIHHVLGWTVVAAGLSQALAAVLRGTKGGPTEPSARGDHFDMTPRRILFERVHKTLGWLVIPLAWAATAYGLVLADAPRWMPVVMALWWVGFLALFVLLQRGGFCIDTYQAIWGDDASHPGNRRRPIGWGISRAVEGRLTGRRR